MKDYNSKAKSEIVQRITTLRFDNYDQDAKIQYINNLQGEHFDDYSKYLSSSLKVDPSLQQTFKDYFEVAKISDENVWNMFRTMYSVDKGGDCKYICMMSMAHADNKYSFLVADMSSTFALTPDLIIKRNSKSLLGGLFEWESTTINQVPHTVTKDDLDVLLNYFDMIAFERFTKFLHSTPKAL